MRIAAARPHDELAAQPGGQVVVADRVVATIVRHAAREIAGVHELVRQESKDIVVRFLQRLVRTTGQSPGVRVRVSGHDVTITLTLAVIYGVSIPEVVAAVRRAVVEQVESLTGLRVRDVTVEVVDVHLPPDASRNGQEQEAPSRG